MTNLNDKLKAKELKLTHREISISTGRAESWFNNSFNNIEDLQISSFIRILAVVNQSLNEKKEDKIDGDFLTSIVTAEVLEIANAINNLTVENDNHLSHFIQEENRLFQDLIGYWGILSSKHKMSPCEEDALEEIRTILNDTYHEQEE